MARTKLPAKKEFGEGGYRFRRYRDSKTVFTVRVRMEPDTEHDDRWWSPGRRVELSQPDDKAELLELAGTYHWELTHPDEVASITEAENERRQSLADYLQHWREIRESDTRLKSDTLERENVELTRIEKYLGDVPLSTVTAVKIEDAYARMVTDGVSEYTHARTHSKLKAVLELAVDEELLPANPAAKVKRNRPRTPKRDKERQAERRITPAEATALTSRLVDEQPDGLRVAIWLARFTGMRRGEVLGLRWSDINTDTFTIHVRYQLDRHGELREPKTPESVRDLPFTVPIWRYLSNWRDIQQEQFAKGFRRKVNGEWVTVKPKWTTRTPVCTNHVGDWWSTGNFNRALRVYFAKCGMGEFTDRTTFEAQRSNGDGEKVRYDCTRASGYVGAGLHSLRHAYATELVSNNVNPKVAQALLGHSDIQTTLNLYAETLPEDMKSAVSLLATRQFEGYSDLTDPSPMTPEEVENFDAYMDAMINFTM